MCKILHFIIEEIKEKEAYVPLYDIICNTCEKVEEMMLMVNDEIPECPDCRSKRERLCNCSHFKLVYNNKTDICSWGDQGYSSSQYHRYTDNK